MATTSHTPLLLVTLAAIPGVSFKVRFLDKNGPGKQFERIGK